MWPGLVPRPVRRGGKARENDREEWRICRRSFVLIMQGTVNGMDEKRTGNARQDRGADSVEEAVAWLECLEGARDDDRELRRAFEAWRHTSPDHDAAFRHVAQTAAVLEESRAAVLARYGDELIERIAPHRPGIRDRFGGAFAAVRRWPPMIRSAAAVAAALLMLVAAWSLVEFLPGATTTYRTARGEVQEFLLADGSRMTLDAASAADVRFGSDRRQVVLRTGAALFDVRHDAARVFEVAAADRLIRVHGTRFAVNLMGRHGEVAVERGAVGVRRKDFAGIEEEMILHPGDAVRFVPGKPEMAKREMAPEAIAAWKDGTLIFDGVPLADALVQINRHLRTGRIRLGRATLAGLPLSGVFEIDTPQATARRLATLLALDVREVDGDPVLDARPDSAT